MVYHVSEHIDCIICLDSFEVGNRAQVKCAHNVCNGCFSKHLYVTINDNFLGFPTCPHPDCHTAASDKLITEHVDERTAARMRYLRVLHPTRRYDGKRMWCTAPGCYEPLPPPTPTDPNSTECPRCSTRTSLLSVPEDNVTTDQIKEYSNGHFAKCPHCGVHVELSRGCQHVTCAQCNHTIKFRPMNSPSSTNRGNKRSITTAAPEKDRTTQPLVTTHSPASIITLSSNARSNDSVDSSNVKEQTAQILARVRAARLERERAQNVHRPVSINARSASSPWEAPRVSPARLPLPPSSETSDDEFGIMARIDNLRAQRRAQHPEQPTYNLDSSHLRRFKSVPSINAQVPERKSVFDEELGTSSPVRSSARTQGKFRRFVGRVIDRDYTRSNNRNIGPLRSQRSTEVEPLSPVSSFRRTPSSSRRQGANLRRFPSSYIPASRENDDRLEILSGRTSIIHA